MADDLRPSVDIRQPGDGTPGDEHHVEGCRLGDRRRCVVEVRMHEACSIGEAQLAGKPARGVDCRCREVQPDDRGAALRQFQAVGAEMTLQVQNAVAIDRPELCLLDGVEAAASGPQAGKIIATRAEMQGDHLIPMGAVDRLPYRLPHNRCSGGRPSRARSYPQVALLPTAVIVMCPIVVSALAPCQWRSPALMCTTSPTLISRCSRSFATMPAPEVTTSTWSQSWVCQPVVHPWLKFTTLQL